MNLAEVQRETFEPHVEQTFKVSLDEASFGAQLIDVSPVGEKVGAKGRRAFSLVFRGPRDVVFEQRICRVEHDELGTMDVFLVPIGPDDEGMRYEAVFT